MINVQENNKEITVGIVGCGLQTSQVYATILPRIPSVSIKYVTDINRELAERIAKSLGAIAVDFNSLIEGVDIAVIASPPHTHYLLAKQALKVCKATICEKPFVTTLDEAQELITLSEECGSLLYVAHVRRLYPSVQMAKRLTESNRYGKLKKIYIHEGSRYSLPVSSNYLVKKKSGGVIYDIGSHAFDMALYIGLMSDVEVTFKINEIVRDKVEPSHHISGKFNIIMGTDTVECKFCISRIFTLSNKITFIYENGRIDIPTVVSDRIRTSSARGSKILTADRNISFMQAYYDQFDAIFSKSDDHIFAAHRFINLTNLIEVISTGEGEFNNE